MSTIVSTHTVKTDAELVRCWRLEQLTRSGYDGPLRGCWRRCASPISTSPPTC
jgi:hypothetical protein